MPFAGTWVVLDIIILNEVRKTNHIAYDITYMWNLKYDTNELIYENRDSQMQKTNLWFPKGKRGGGADKSGGWNQQKHTIIHKINNRMLLHSTGNYI